MRKGFGVMGLADWPLVRYAVNFHLLVISFPPGVPLSGFSEIAVGWSFTLWAEKHLNHAC